LLDAVNNLGWRTVGMSGKGATVAGTTATAKQDDFGPAEWTLEAGAFVKAHKGMVAIDELDDMDPEVRASMLEPMSKQRINVNKAGINAELSTETAVVAAGNPKYGRWDEYEPLFEQFDLEDNLISRFDLIYTVSDDLDPDEDQEVAEHVLETRDESKRKMSGLEVTGDEKTATPVDQDILRKWVAVAKDQDPPVFADDEVKEWLKESFTDLRGIHGHDEDATVPVTFRKLEGIVRIAEAAAKLELSDTIEMRHARLATNAVGESIRDYGTNEDGELDADVQESGQSKSEAERKEALKEVIKNLQSAEGNDGSAPVETIVEAMEERGYRESKVWKDIKRFKNKGMAYEPNPDSLRWVGST
jgi:replicative DNA helicase Mcm